MSLLLFIQTAFRAATPWLVSSAGIFVLMSVGAHVAKRMPLREPLAQFRRLGLFWQIVVVLSVGSATRWAGAKGDRGGAPYVSEPTPSIAGVGIPSEPSLSIVSVHTNGVVFRAATSNAAEVVSWRTIGGTEMGVWIESQTNSPFFAVGTDSVLRAYASASGAVSFESMRRPPVGAALPDGTRLPVLCPLRTPLGFVPEANAAADAQSRFWHDALPGGGIVLTWENSLVDRLPDRRVSIQVEMRPMGDCVFRYDFQDALDPPATNFVMGAQVGTNGVNALAILGTNLLSATVWNVDGAPVTNGVAIADVLCTNGVLRTPSSFEIRWRNTTGLASDADSDGDGLTDGEEVFVWGTSPNLADTDGDGLADGGEVIGGTNPLDADENADGVPDGQSAAAWGGNALWSTNAPAGAGNVTITLNDAIPAGTTASLVVGDLCIPLRAPGSWSLGLVPGQIYPYRLVVGGPSAANLSIGPEATPPLRGPLDEMSIALWLDGIGGAFDGWSVGGSGTMVIPAVITQWDDPGDGSHDGTSGGVCLHGGDEAVFTPIIQPSSLNKDWSLSNLEVRNGKLVLSVPDDGEVHSGTATLLSGNIRFGTVQATVSAHRCDSSYNTPYCSICGHYNSDDLSLSVRSPLTLKHDNQTPISISHPNSTGTTIENATVQIRRKNESAWLTLGSPSSLNPWTAKIAGTFEMRGIGTVLGQSVETPIEEVEVRFPSIFNLVNNSQIIDMANAAWAATLADCTPTNRRERGFWIYLDTSVNSYEAGPTLYGNPCGPDDEASVSMSPRPPDAPPLPSAIASGARYPVASFHCHTPTTYRLTATNFLGRAVGPSPDDWNIDEIVDQVPGLVYDYVDLPRHDGNIYPGLPIDSPAIIYESIGRERRPTP